MEPVANKDQMSLSWTMMKDMLEKKNRISSKELALRYLVAGCNMPIRRMTDAVIRDDAFNGFHDALKEDAIDIITMINGRYYQYAESKALLQNALHLLAKLSSSTDTTVSSYALNTGVDMCLDGKDILMFAGMISCYRGFGRLVKKILSRWYLDMDPRRLLELVLMDKSAKVTFYENDLKKKEISFSHRNLVRRLHLRGTDDIQDAAFRMIKGFRGDASEVPSMFRILDEINSLDFRAPGSVDVAINYSRGVQFQSKLYANELQESDKFMQELFYSGNMSYREWAARFFFGHGNHFLVDDNADRICFLMKTWLDRQQMPLVDLLVIREKLKAEGGFETLVAEMKGLYYKYPVPEQSDETASFVFLKHKSDNIIPLIHAYDKAYRYGGNLIICGLGVFPLDVKGVDIDAIIANIPEFFEKDKLMQSVSLFNILNGSQVKFKKIYVAERDFILGDHEGFLNALDTYVTGKSPEARIVHHVLTRDLFEEERVLLAEPRHGNVMTFYGANPGTTHAIETFLCTAK